MYNDKIKYKHFSQSSNRNISKVAWQNSHYLCDLVCICKLYNTRNRKENNKISCKSSNHLATRKCRSKESKISAKPFVEGKTK